MELQRKFVNKTLFEIVARGNRIDLQKVVRLVDPSCELIQDDPVEVSGKRRFVFSTEKGEELAEKVLKTLLSEEAFNLSEFQVSRPDLETIFLRATKKNWEEQDFIGRRNRRIRMESKTKGIEINS